MVCLSDFLIIKSLNLLYSSIILISHLMISVLFRIGFEPIYPLSFGVFPIKLTEHMNWKLPRRRFTNPSRLWYFLALSQHSITKDTRQVDVSWWLLMHFHHQRHKTQRTSQISKDIRKLIPSLYLTYILYINFEEKSIFKLSFLQINCAI